MVTSNEARVLLRATVSVDAVHQWAYRHDYLVQKIADRRGGKTGEDVWCTLDRSAWLHLVEDPYVQLRYLVVRGGDVAGLIAAARATLDTVPHADVLAQLATATSAAEQIDLLYKLAVAAPMKPNAKVRAALERAFLDADASVRHAAIVATGYLGWSRLKTLLGKLSVTDPVESVRRDAALMLEVLG